MGKHEENQCFTFLQASLYGPKGLDVLNVIPTADDTPFFGQVMNVVQTNDFPFPKSLPVLLKSLGLVKKPCLTKVKHVGFGCASKLMNARELSIVQTNCKRTVCTNVWRLSQSIKIRFNTSSRSAETKRLFLL